MPFRSSKQEVPVIKVDFAHKQRLKVTNNSFFSEISSNISIANDARHFLYLRAEGEKKRRQA